MAKHLAKDNKVFGLIRKKSDWQKHKNLITHNILSDIKLIEGDLNDAFSLAKAMDESQPDVIFHLGGQSFVPLSFKNPLDTLKTNTIGTANLLEVARIKSIDPKIVFAGSSEEYGLVFSSEQQHQDIIKKYGSIYPEPTRIPELPIDENNPLRPMSPYGVSKVHGDFLMRDYYHTYGLKTIISRAFNHEGACRGIKFVTSSITQQIIRLKLGEIDKITIGNVNAFRDWSHVNDVVEGYVTLAEKGRFGDVYNQGSMRTNSVLSYLLLSLETAGWGIDRIETMFNGKKVEKPTEINKDKYAGLSFEKTKVDDLMLANKLSFDISDGGIIVHTNKGLVKIEFDKEMFRPSEVPILLSDTSKINKLGVKVNYKLVDIIKDQLNYFLDKANRDQ